MLKLGGPLSVRTPYGVSTAVECGLQGRITQRGSALPSPASASPSARGSRHPGRGRPTASALLTPRPMPVSQAPADHNRKVRTGPEASFRWML